MAQSAMDIGSGAASGNPHQGISAAEVAVDQVIAASTKGVLQPF